MWKCEAGGPEVGVEELRTLLKHRGGTGRSRWESVPGRTPNHRLQVRSVSLKPESYKGSGGYGAENPRLCANSICVQVPFLPLWCRDERVSPAVATDPQSAKRGSQAVTRHPTGTPVEPS